MSWAHFFRPPSLNFTVAIARTTGTKKKEGGKKEGKGGEKEQSALPLLSPNCPASQGRRRGGGKIKKKKIPLP